VPCHDLLLSIFGIGSLLLCTLLTNTSISSLTSSLPKLPVSASVNSSRHILLVDILDLLVSVNDRKAGPDGRNVALASGLELFLAGIPLLGLAEFTREEDQAGLVFLEAGDVQSEGLFGVVLAASVDDDTDGRGELAWDTGFFQFGESEATSGSDAAVVLDSWASDDWVKLVYRSRGNGRSLCDTGIAASEFATWLVEVDSDAALPILSEMVVWDLLIVLDRHSGCLRSSRRGYR